MSKQTNILNNKKSILETSWIRYFFLIRLKYKICETRRVVILEVGQHALMNVFPI